MCDLNAEDLLPADSCQTTGGLKVTGYWAYYSDIVAPFPAPAAAPANMAEAATVIANFAMETGKYFYKIEGDLEGLNLTSESQGNLNNLSAANRYKFKVSGTSKQMVGFVNSCRNRKLIFIVEDADGNKRILGQDGLPAVFQDFGEMSGEKAADDKAITFTAYAPGNLPYFYEGTIPLAPVAPVV